MKDCNTALASFYTEFDWIIEGVPVELQEYAVAERSPVLLMRTREPYWRMTCINWGRPGVEAELSEGFFLKVLEYATGIEIDGNAYGVLYSYLQFRMYDTFKLLEKNPDRIRQFKRCFALYDDVHSAFMNYEETGLDEFRLEAVELMETLRLWVKSALKKLERQYERR